MLTRYNLLCFNDIKNIRLVEWINRINIIRSNHILNYCTFETDIQSRYTIGTITVQRRAKKEIKINWTKEYRNERSQKRKIFEPLISIVGNHRNWFLYRILCLKHEVSRKIVSWKPRYPSPLPPFNIDFPSRETNRDQRIPPLLGVKRVTWAP